jgi:hypothetical protein
MSNLNKIMNKLCMRSCIPYYRSRKVGFFLKQEGQDGSSLLIRESSLLIKLIREMLDKYSDKNVTPRVLKKQDVPYLGSVT